VVTYLGEKLGSSFTEKLEIIAGLDLTLADSMALKRYRVFVPAISFATKQGNQVPL